MQIVAEFKSNVTDELDNILNKGYEEETNESYIAERFRRKELKNFRLMLKKEIIYYLSIFFKGQFFNLCEYDYSIVPSIDFYCLNNNENSEIFQGGSL